MVNKTFFKKHLDLAVLLGILVPCVIAAGSVLLSSKVKYSIYEKEYDAQIQALEEKQASGPKEVYIDNQFCVLDREGKFIERTKSKYKNIYNIMACEASIKSNIANVGNIYKYENSSIFDTYLSDLGREETAVEFNFYMKDHAKGDIDLVLSTNMSDISGLYCYSTEDLLSLIDLNVNGKQVKDFKIDLPTIGEKSRYNTNFKHVILKECNFKEGKNVVELKTKTINPYINNQRDYIMPNIRNLTVFTEGEFDKNVVFNGDESFVLQDENTYYFGIAGTSIGYDVRSLEVVLLNSLEEEIRLNKQDYSLEIKNNNFVYLVNADSLPENTKVYPYLYIDAEPFTDTVDGALEINVLKNRLSSNYVFDKKEDISIVFEQNSNRTYFYVG